MWVKNDKYNCLSINSEIVTIIKCEKTVETLIEWKNLKIKSFY